MENFDTSKQIRRSIHLFKQEGEIAELRIIPEEGSGAKVLRSTSEDQLIDQIQKFNGSANVYMIMNPLFSGKSTAASDSDILSLNWLLLDFDPKEKNYAATNTLADSVMEALTIRGWPKPVVASSGRGVHLLYPINLENNLQNCTLLRSVLKSLSDALSTPEVLLDPVTYNPSRLCRVYGTDNVKDGQNRPSFLISDIDHKEVVNVVQLSQIVDELSQGCPDSNLDRWLSNTSTNVIKKDRWKDIATRYVLNPCPFNSDHQNQSAYILHFDSGAIIAGCHHKSCQHKNWADLRSMYESVPNDTNTAPSSILISLSEKADYFIDELEEGYASVEIQGHRELYKVRSQKFRKWLTFLYYKKTGKAPSTEAMHQALSVIETKAMFEGETVSLNRRVAKNDGKFFYDMGDTSWSVVELHPTGWRLLETPPVLFVRNKNMKGQVNPGALGNVHLIDKHFRFRSHNDLLLFKVYLIHCLVPDIPHLIAIFHGEKGSSKTTSVRKVRRIIDPASRELLSLPKGKNELALSLANNYMPVYDNLEKLQSHQSELICIASTGGGLSKRTLYTDEDETILDFKRCVVLNGINIVATRPDLLDRAILLELERIPSKERKEESVLWTDFEQDLPTIFTGVLNVICTAMNIYPTLNLTELPRMADACKWGYAIAEAMGESGENFLKVYKENQRITNRETIADHPVAAAIVALMKSNQTYESSVSALLANLEKIAVEEKINVQSQLWPKASNVLSKRLKEVKSNLSEVGIKFEFVNSKNATRIHINTKIDQKEKNE